MPSLMQCRRANSVMLITVLKLIHYDCLKFINKILPLSYEKLKANTLKVQRKLW